ncbi:hypothetical protein UFOVP891_14 [uncultured Caudovirales phage]|uniref:Uncharacterized protein n=1 Tax=uncultured Caudovirales phage TaxID=2100421 RepID=A0A6J5PAS7_9CAUD|nr:hypothetical protein UFOVP472_54 [uncultured Caudovirales phage]CAB4168970.1 hypothetical protein UFOVP891_14 [uncultured Caudovirales phage]CAB4180794.1 hypothetical protein UFOVP1053_54 [uncultured Caudovirales phage]CAB4195550.1 hypothetical protein UFOVP1297_20 [uncultured Caudovirales phage]CAB4221924.1 hypothetical protein UFOVP1647_60 [uncultured Caudovirales phage]
MTTISQKKLLRDLAKQSRQRFCASRPLTLRRLWAKVRIAQLKFDIWYHGHMAMLDERDIQHCQYSLSSELLIVADLRLELKRWTGVAE